MTFLRHERQSSVDEGTPRTTRSEPEILARLIESEERFRSLVWNSADAIVGVDLDQAIMLWNFAAEDMFGYRETEILGQSLAVLLPTEARGTHGDLVESFASEEADRRPMRSGGQFSAVRRSGERFPVEVALAKIPFGDRPMLMATVRDISENVEIAAELARASDRFRLLAETSLDGLAVVDDDGIIRYMGGPEVTALGRNSGDLVGQSVMLLLQNAHPEDYLRVFKQYEMTLAEPGSSRTIEGRFQHSNGSWRWMSISARNLLGERAVAGIVMNVQDITERKVIEAELEQQALHDSLTGLPSRKALLTRLDQLLAGDRDGDHAIGLLFLDLDRFKDVNDTLGHSVGDQLLVLVSERLREVVGDNETLARFGGDEFVVLCENITGLPELESKAERLRQSLIEPIYIEDREFYSPASIGLALTSAGEVSSETLLSNADAAMYRAKRAGRNRIAAFDIELQDQLEHRINTEIALRGALTRDEFLLHFQPVIDISSRNMVGVEALIRWDSPSTGLVQPDGFVPIAEETDLINSIGAWVIKEACERLVDWRRRYDSEFWIAINVSARQLASNGFPELVAKIVAETEINPEWVCLEITETALIDRPALAVSNLEAIRSTGIDVALDDFGTGYASLAYMRTLPITAIKIDRSFISGLGMDLNDTIIVQSTIALAHGLGLGVVAEGVETEEQFSYLKKFGCDEAQGFYLGRPATAESLESDRIMR